jgi:primosomal protein N' (replication factor Y)
MSKYCKVAVKYPGPFAILTYAQPEDCTISIGSLVEVSLRKRKASGCILEYDIPLENLSEKEIKLAKANKIVPINQLLQEEFFLTEKELNLYQWMSKYYHYNVGMVIFECLPKMLKRPRKVELQKGKNIPLPHELNQKQKNIFEDINSKRLNGFDKFYLHGVTGSGKTLVYLNLVKEVLKEGESVLFLLPEINLTPQFTEEFLNHVDCPVLPYHSAVSDSEKNTIWKTLKANKEPVVVMGVRSSVFLPIENLGLVIVDEEHDQSFKQSDRCPYNGRDVAIKKAQLANAPIIMGSATPSVENYYGFKLNDKFKNNYYTLKQRAAGSFPEVKLLDCRSTKKKNENSELIGSLEEDIWPLQEESVSAIRESFEKQEQVLVFINRLGFANYLQCRACGYKFVDPNTDTPLRYFKNKNILSSAHSDYQIPVPEICPDCGNMNLLRKGFGTERIQEVLQGIFPQKCIERFDRDEIKNIEQLNDKLDRFHNGEIDIFVGTQMLSKGHNFKRVNLVLILGVDSLMNFPDFRAIEKTYQTITQITGRAGRYSPNAEVLIQTLSPDNNVFSHITSHGFDSFYDSEIMIRDFAKFPPYSRMANIFFSSRFRDRVIDNIVSVVDHLKKFIDHKSFEVEIMGPAPASIEKRSGQFTWCLSLKSSNINELHNVLGFFNSSYKRVSGISFKIDVDPYQSL